MVSRQKKQNKKTQSPGTWGAMDILRKNDLLLLILVAGEMAQ